MIRALAQRWKNIVSGPQLPPALKLLWTFDSPQQLQAKWLTTCDSEIGGKSTVQLCLASDSIDTTQQRDPATGSSSNESKQLVLNAHQPASNALPFAYGSADAPDRHAAFSAPAAFARFSGVISLETAAGVDRSGYAAFRTRPLRPPLDLEYYDSLRVRYRGDGRTYMLNVQGESVMPEDLYQAFLPSEPGRWLQATIPLASLLLTWRGFVQPDQPQIDGRAVVSVGVCLADGQAGAYQLDLAEIAALRGDGS